MEEAQQGMKQEKQPSELLDLLRKETSRVEGLARSMAGIVLTNPAQHDAVTDAANRLVEASQVVLQAANDLEIVRTEAFGDEESYWTVFRMFTTRQNAGRIWSLEEIWQYLAKNYDMSGETRESLEDTLLEWKEDFEADFAQRGAEGVFMRHEYGFVFAPRLVSRPVAEVEKSPVKTPEQIVADPEDDQKAPPTIRERLGEGIQAMLRRNPDEIVRQADAKSWILKDNPQLDPAQLQEEIDVLVAKGVIYKFRRNKVAYLSLIERPDESALRHVPGKETKTGEEELIDINTARQVLEALCAPRRHVQQKIMINDLWRLVNSVTDRGIRPPDAEIEALKRLCKQLSERGLVVAVSEKIGTGGVKTNSPTSSKRRRSNNRQVFKVGLPSQGIKEQLQSILSLQPRGVRAELNNLINPENEV